MTSLRWLPFLLLFALFTGCGEMASPKPDTTVKTATGENGKLVVSATLTVEGGACLIPPGQTTCQVSHSESPFQGSFTIRNESGSVSMTITTDSSGLSTEISLAPDTYTVSYSDPNGGAASYYLWHPITVKVDEGESARADIALVIEAP